MTMTACHSTWFPRLTAWLVLALPLRAAVLPVTVVNTSQAEWKFKTKVGQTRLRVSTGGKPAETTTGSEAGMTYYKIKKGITEITFEANLAILPNATAFTETFGLGDEDSNYRIIQGQYKEVDGKATVRIKNSLYQSNLKKPATFPDPEDRDGVVNLAVKEGKPRIEILVNSYQLPATRSRSNAIESKHTKP